MPAAAHDSTSSLELGHAECDDLGDLGFPCDLARNGECLGHGHVEQHDVRYVFQQALMDFRCAGDAAYDVNARCLAQHLREAFPIEPHVAGDQRADRLGSRLVHVHVPVMQSSFYSSARTFP